MSQLTSIPSIQAITKKSIVKKLLGGDDTAWREENTTLQELDIHITLDHNTCYVLLNTTGVALHNR